MEGFSSIAALLIVLTQKKVKILWLEACEKSFQELKDRLPSTQVLTLLEGTNGFVIYCDTSRIGLGKVETHGLSLGPRPMGGSRQSRSKDQGPFRALYALLHLGYTLGRDNMRQRWPHVGDYDVGRCICFVRAGPDLIELEMLDFLINMGMDWLKPCYANVDYREKTVRFQFPREVVQGWGLHGRKDPMDENPSYLDYKALTSLNIGDLT
ncbi:hypothetical protein MTR67_023727 [Solanum verrucosum]|uniref:Uncharacterized protein n=1 Tax=Solanum verrucosum TaxID=315347 RepID=A0AAF0QU31_SOLVR|nr:hypothetical protein MTR67_023727 [Solanum verrucosum]